MTYKVKAACLSALVAVLAFVYILTLVFNPENRRSNAFALLDSDLIIMADGIEITAPESSVSLSRRNNVWFFNSGAGELPVKQDRVNDLFALLSRKEAYPVRAVSSEARETLALTEERGASRIRVLGGAGLPLLDLFIGGEDVMGREVYLRMEGRDEIYSGENQFASFIDGRPASWYDLRLFRPANADNRGSAGAQVITIDSVQQAGVELPAGESYTLSRNGGGWVLQGNESAALETVRVEAWLRSVLEAEGEDFAEEGFAAGAAEGRVTLMLGDGSSRTIEIGPADDETKSRIAVVSPSPFAYILPEWNVNGLFPESSLFIKTP